MKKKFYILQSLLLIVMIAAFSNPCFAGEFKAFGNKDYEREKGKPQIITDSFSIDNLNTEYFLRAYNGGLDHSEDLLVSSVIIYINDIQVVGPNNFNQNVFYLENPIINQLALGDNTIAVEVRSKPGCLLTINITGICTDIDGDGFAIDGRECGSIDCDDNNASIYPGANDSICNGIDENCNGIADDEYVPTLTSCGVGECHAEGMLECINGEELDSCIPGEPIEEICGDGIDNNCNGEVDEGCEPEEGSAFLTVAGGSGWWDQANSLVVTPDDGYLIAGGTNDITGHEQPVLYKYHSTGSLSWAKSVSGSPYNWLISIAKTTEDGYIATGHCNNSYDLSLLKFDAEYNLSWARAIGGGSASETGFCIQQTADNGYIVAGDTKSFDAYGSEDVLIQKFDASGNTIWAKTIGESGQLDIAYSVSQTSDDGYIVVGAGSSYGLGGYDAYIFKFNNAGALEWGRVAGGAMDDFAYCVHQTGDSGYILTGRTASFGEGDNDILLMKIDSSGNLLWAKTTGGSGEDISRSMDITFDGCYIVGGYTFSYGLGQNDFFLLKYNINGDLLWARTVGGEGVEEITFVHQSLDGGCAFIGITKSFGFGGGANMFGKTNSLGNIDGCPYIQPCSPIVKDQPITFISINPEVIERKDQLSNVLQSWSDITFSPETADLCYTE
jgi:hypothetical protein